MVLAGCGRLSFDDLPTQGDGGTAVDDTIDVTGDAQLTPKFAYLKPTNTETFDQFGYVLALSADGTTLVAGTPLEDGPGNALAQSGCVYVFVRSGDTWVQQGYLRSTDIAGNDQFGASVAVSETGDTIAIGAPDKNTSRGSAYVFARSGGLWTQQAAVTAFNGEIGDAFGWTVSLSASGDTLAVGAPFEDSPDTGIDTAGGNGAGDAGAAYTFTRAGTTWSPQSYLKASNTGAGDNFGYVVALSGDGKTVLVSAPAEDSATNTIGGDQNDNSTTEAGAVYALRFGTTWTYEAYIKPSTTAFGDFFGRVLALSADGNTLAASSPGDDTVVANSGAVFTFARSGTTWTESQKLKAPNAGDNDQFSWALALSDTHLLVSAPLEDSDAAGLDGDLTNDNRPNSGAVYQFRRTTLTWTIDRYVKQAKPDSSDEFGNALAISGDGLTRAAAAHYEDSAATMVNGDATDNTAIDSGSVEVRYY